MSILKSINPYNNETISEYEIDSEIIIQSKVESAEKAFYSWRNLTIESRLKYFEKLQQVIIEKKNELAKLATLEMGKLLSESISEVEKCAATIGAYINNASQYLADERAEIKSAKAYETYQPLGVILGIMPWNFPYWQAFRFAIPTLIAGNTIVLKHASNVSGCSLATEKLFIEAGFPENIFQSVLVPGDKVGALIKLPQIKAISLTGSTAAGKSVAEIAGGVVKKCVLELGGNDPYIVLKDADIKKAAEICAKSRLQNAGQSCVAAKRFIIVKEVYDDFLHEFTEQFKNRRSGDPLDPQTTIAPLVNIKAKEGLQEQVNKSIGQGAHQHYIHEKNDYDNAYFSPIVLTNVNADTTSFKEEMFGPVASVIKAADEKHAIELANNSLYGLGSAIFSKDIEHAEKIARHSIEAGMVFINDMVRSDAAIAFGGIKESGYGRELTKFGIREFTNIKTVYIA